MACLYHKAQDRVTLCSAELLSGLDGCDLLVIYEAHCCDICHSSYAISRLLYDDVAAQKVTVAKHLKSHIISQSTEARP